MDRFALIAGIQNRLAGRRIVWAGLRREDALPLADIHELAGVFGIQGSFDGCEVEGVALEEITGVREDPEVWDIDDHLQEPEIHEFRSQILAALDRPSVMLPYRSSAFLASLCFARSANTQHLGVFWGHLDALDHKPWVESSLRMLGIRTIPWTYIADEEQFRIIDFPVPNGLVLRRSRTSGGEGFTRVFDKAEAIDLWPSTSEYFASVAPFIEGTPVNVGAVVWRDGVTVHHPSVQLIGIATCTNRAFGYCGNDFGAVRGLSRNALSRIEDWTRIIGDWLRSNGFIGAYGVDYLVNGDEVWFTEVNPRFQGSTLASCELDAEGVRPCLMTEHMAAWLGIPCVESPGADILTRIDSTPCRSTIVVHWLGPHARVVDAFGLINGVDDVLPHIHTDLIPPQGVASRPGSAVARITLGCSITDDGFTIDDRLATRIAAWQVRESHAERGGDVDSEGNPR